MITVQDIRNAIRHLDPDMEVRLTMTVYKGGDFFIAPVTSIEVNTKDYIEDGITRLFICGIPEGHEED